MQIIVLGKFEHQREIFLKKPGGNDIG